MGWPLCGEIDVLEYVGRAPGEIFTTLHTKAASGDFANTKTTALPNVEEGFHRYTADWNKDRIAFYVDDALVYTFAPEDKSEEVWPFNQPFYLLLNLAIGGHFGGEVDESIFPQEFVIDYIRIVPINLLTFLLFSKEKLIHNFLRQAPKQEKTE